MGHFARRAREARRLQPNTLTGRALFVWPGSVAAGRLQAEFGRPSLAQRSPLTRPLQGAQALPMASLRLTGRPPDCSNLALCAIEWESRNS